MIPSRAWFPSSLQDRAAWYANFQTQFDVVGTTLGFTAAEVLVIGSDASMFEFLAANTTALDAFSDAFRQYRIVLTEGDIGDPTPAFPANPTATPASTAATGIFERLVRYVERIRVAPAYTPEIGALLGIIPKSSGDGPSNPDDLKPVIKAGLSFGGYSFDVNVTRLGQSGYKVQIQRQNQSTWTDVAFATNNPCTVTITPTTPTDPERIYVRAILLNKNDPVGEPSDPTYVTVNP